MFIFSSYTNSTSWNCKKKLKGGSFVRFSTSSSSPCWLSVVQTAMRRDEVGEGGGREGGA